MAFKENTTPIAVTDEVVQAVMKHKGITEKDALFLLGFRLDNNLMTKVHMVRNPVRRYEIYETKVHHGLLRNKVQVVRNELGKFVTARNEKGQILYKNESHPMALTYETYIVVGMKDVSSHDMININDFGNPEAVN